VVVGDARSVDDHGIDAGVGQVLDALTGLIHPADQELLAEALGVPPKEERESDRLQPNPPVRASGARGSGAPVLAG
jgi:hypothetical protein